MIDVKTLFFFLCPGCDLHSSDCESREQLGLEKWAIFPDGYNAQILFIFLTVNIQDFLQVFKGSGIGTEKFLQKKAELRKFKPESRVACEVHDFVCRFV